VLAEERFELVEWDQVGLVVEVDVAGVRDDVELLRLGRALVGVLAVVPGVGVLSRDEQDRPRRDPLDVRQEREVYAARWLLRYLEECDGATIDEAAMVAACLAALAGARHGDAALTLRVMAER
jgi:hypothetical protein